MPPKVPGKRSKSKTATPAKRQKKAAKAKAEESSSESSEEDTTAAAAPAPKSPAKTPEKKDKKSLGEDAKDTFRDLAAKVVKGEKLKPSDFNSLTVNDFKNALKLNDRSSTGNRGDLLKAVTDCMTNGCPPRCPDCGGGRLRFNKKKYTCPGYMEDEDFVRCSATFTEAQIDRIPWKSP